MQCSRDSNCVVKVMVVLIRWLALLAISYAVMAADVASVLKLCNWTFVGYHASLYSDCIILHIIYALFNEHSMDNA